jgi:hypothetical protein
MMMMMMMMMMMDVRYTILRLWVAYIFFVGIS